MRVIKNKNIAGIHFNLEKICTDKERRKKRFSVLAEFSSDREWMLYKMMAKESQEIVLDALFECTRIFNLEAVCGESSQHVKYGEPWRGWIYEMRQYKKMSIRCKHIIKEKKENAGTDS